MTRIYLEQGKTKIVACSLDWPGWCRFGKTEDAAVSALCESAPRYPTSYAIRRFTWHVIDHIWEMEDRRS